MAMSQLPDRLATRIARSVLRQGANTMARKIRAAAPVKTGRLRKAIRVRNSSIHTLRKNGNVGVYVTVYAGKNRKDIKGAWYAKFVENGYSHGSKAVTGRQAVTLGIVDQKTLDAKKRLIASKRRIGRYKQGIRYRSGGKAIEGLHFVRDTFNANASQAGQQIISASYVALDSITRELGLNR